MPATLQPPPIPQDLYGVSPYQADPFPEADFVNKSNVPVFAEHETTTRDGRQLKFGYAELSAVADRCNRRIQETGDYAALSIGHNPEPEAKVRGAPTPKTVGYAGPFRIGTINGQDGTKKVAILADLHYFKSDWEEAKKYGRRSAELWVEDRYEEMFLDPIALLGAETPRLDLGLVYQMQGEDGRMVIKYARPVQPYTAVFPGSMNTHVPKTKDYGMDNPQMPTADAAQPDLVKSIVDALCALPQWQFLESMMAEKEAEGANDQMMPGQPGMPGDPTGSVGDAQVDQTAQPLPAGSPMANPPLPPPAASSSPPASPPTAEGPPQASPMEPSPPQAKEEQPPTKPPFPEKEKNAMPAMNYQAALYAAMDRLDDDTLEQYMAGRKRKPYQAEGEVDGEEEPPADAGTYNQSPGAAPGVSAEGEKTIKESGAEEPSSTGKADYSRGNSQTLKYQLDDVTMRLKKMEAAREEERRGRIDAERRQRLQEYQHQGFLPGDINKAMERLCYAKIADDKQFDDMLEMMLENAPARIPIGLSLPNVEGAEMYNRHRPGFHRPGFKDESSEKYSKEVQEKARKNVTRIVNAAAAKREMLDTEGLWAAELEKAASLNGAA